MTVQAYDAGGAFRLTASTDSAGRYQLVLPAGMYRVLAFDSSGIHATNFYSNAESFETSQTLSLQTSLPGINFVLVQAGAVAGVVSSESGAPLTPMTVAVYNLSGTRRGFTTSDAAGRYQIVLPPGTYKVVAFDETENYAPTFYADVASFEAATPVTIIAGQSFVADIRLVRAAIVTGRVTDAATGAGIAGATVSLYVDNMIAAAVAADSEGRYRVSVRSRAYRIVAFDPAGVYAAAYLPDAGSFEASPVFNLAAGETRNIDAQLVRAGRFTGRVSDAATAAPLADIGVAAFNADGTTRTFTTTDASGNYTLVVPPGAFRVGAYDPHLVYLSRFYPNESRFADAPPWNAFASQTTTLNLTLPRGGVITGRVATASLTPLSGMTVAAYDPSGDIVSATLTGPDGTYRLLLEPGGYKLAAFDASFHYATAYGTAAVGGGQTTPNQNFTLVSGAHVSGSVKSVDGTPLEGMTVAAYDNGGAEVATTRSRPGGLYDLVVPPASYRFAAYDPQRTNRTSGMTAPVTLSATNNVTTVNLVLRESAGMRIRRVRH